MLIPQVDSYKTTPYPLILSFLPALDLLTPDKPPQYAPILKSIPPISQLQITSKCSATFSTGSPPPSRSPPTALPGTQPPPPSRTSSPLAPRRPPPSASLLSSLTPRRT